MATAEITPSAYKTGVYHYRKPLADAIDSGLPRFKVGYVTCPATTDAGDTATIDVYDKFGISKVLIVREFAHTTTDSVIIEETLVTTAVSGHNIVVTIPVGTDDDKRFIIVYGI